MAGEVDKKSNGPTMITTVAGYSIIWLVLSGGELASLVIGIPCVLLATAAAVALPASSNLVWYEGLKFLPYFFWRSLLGGVDVAWRAFHPLMPIAPDMIEYPTSLPKGLAQVVMANTISLLPGTLSAQLDHGVITVHVLDGDSDFLSEIKAVECRLARVFGTASAPLGDQR